MIRLAHCTAGEQLIITRMHHRDNKAVGRRFGLDVVKKIARLGGAHYGTIGRNTWHITRRASRSLDYV